ncbi:uncharacterized protein L201_007655 [Kwoniella dendrophila CBS 6074]|uniref:ASX DEUBAD domain-containing protein n=1 Tax=Kwoniella dendrophila CBS 6074 TaxID=1295534 RepID=A0AAX4K4P3_9TREE
MPRSNSFGTFLSRKRTDPDQTEGLDVESSVNHLKKYTKYISTDKILVLAKNAWLEELCNDSVEEKSLIWTPSKRISKWYNSSTTHSRLTSLSRVTNEDFFNIINANPNNEKLLNQIQTVKQAIERIERLPPLNPETIFDTLFSPHSSSISVHDPNVGSQAANDGFGETQLDWERWQFENGAADLLEPHVQTRIKEELEEARR